MTRSPLTTRVASTTKYSSRLGQRPVMYIIHHTTGTNLESDLTVLSGPKPGNQKSANYLLGPAGEVVSIVPEEFRAWTSGSQAVDGRAITAETVNTSRAPSWQVSALSIERHAQLAADFSRRYGWGALSRTNVKGHRDFQATECLPQDSTELLTRSGWVPLRDIRIGDEVSSVHIDTLDITFSPVLDKVEPREQDYYTARGVSATKGHRMLYSLQRSKGHNRVAEWAEVLAGCKQAYIPNAGYYSGSMLPLSYDELTFLVAIQADGHYMWDRERPERPYGIEFHFKKKRKIDQVAELSEKLGYEPRVTSTSSGSTKIRIYGQPVLEFAESWLENKNFSWKFLEMSQAQAAHFLDVIQDFDGSRANRSYSSTIQQNLDVVNAVAALNGVGSRPGDDRIYLRGSRRTIPSNTEVTRHRKGRSELVSCVTVDTGFILIRQHGVTSVVGNCPGPFIWARMGDIIARANQIRTGTNAGFLAHLTPAQRDDVYRWVRESVQIDRSIHQALGG